MTSRIPPSRRDPEHAPWRAAKVVARQTPGAGRVAGVAKQGVSEAVAAALRGKAQSPARSVLFSSTAADGPPTDGSVFWYVTDESC